MQSFIQRFKDKISGVLSGWDRIRFRGTLRWIACQSRLMSFLSNRSILLKNFRTWSQGLTEQIREATEALADREGLKVHYVFSSAVSKEEIAQVQAAERWNREGLSCILSCVEPCYSFKISRNAEAKRLDLSYRPMKCLHYYFYLRHPEIGPLHLRLQTWLPFNVFVCINGRDWLGCELTRANIPHTQCDNTFCFVQDVTRAQELLDRQLRTNWSRLLDGILRQVHPVHPQLFQPGTLDYYWSAEQTEWATDTMFRSPQDLAELYPRLVRHGMLNFGGDDVLRFLGRRGTIRQLRSAHLQSDLKRRHEGMRLKHALNNNSVKMYDKQQTVLRVETTINNPRNMKAYRTAPGNPQGPKKWQQLRKGVADLRRRAKISQAANSRYLEALATADADATLEKLAQCVCRPVTWKRRRVRALNLLADEDARLLEAVNRGEFAINGFRNRDLSELLYPKGSTDSAEAKRRSAKITRQLRLLRGHHLIRKVSHTHRYVLTVKGHTTINTLLAAKNATSRQLTQLAV